MRAAPDGSSGDVPPVPVAPPVKKLKSVSIKSINNASTWQIETEENIKKYVSELEIKLIDALEEVTVINIEFWGNGAIDSISEQLNKELPGLRGFTSRNLRYMRTFYEEWRMLDNPEYPERDMENKTSNLEVAISKLDNRISLPVWNLEMPNYQKFPMDAFLHIGFTHHNVILGKIKDIEERIFLY